MRSQSESKKLLRLSIKPWKLLGKSRMRIILPSSYLHVIVFDSFIKYFKSQRLTVDVVDQLAYTLDKLIYCEEYEGILLKNFT